MAEVVQTLLAFPPDKKELSPKEFDTKIKSHIRELEKIPPAAWTKQQQKKGLLEFIDPSVNSVAFLYTLCAQIEASAKDPRRLEALASNCIIFFSAFDPVQVRYAGDKWRDLFDWTQAQLSATASAELNVLINALLRLDPSAGTFTSSHLHILRRCLVSRHPSLALPILDRDIFAFPPKSSKSVSEDLPSEEHELSNAYITEKSGFSHKLESHHVLEYYLLGAQIYIGLRNYSRARLFLEYVILTPTQQHTTSALQVEAYKKWLLLGLLAEGKVFPHPKTLGQVVLKNLKACAKAYDAIAEYFEKRETLKFSANLQQGISEWQEDGNLRLINEVHRALIQYRVIDLQKTYAVLPISRIASLLNISPEETLRLVQEMIRAGHLEASISASADPVLRFHSADATGALTDVNLTEQTARIQSLVNYVRDADRRLQLTKEYVEWAKRNKRAGGPDGDLADQMDLTWDAPAGNVNDEDEDIMSS